MSGDDNTTEPPKNSRAAAKAERRLNLIDATITSIAKYGLSGTTLARVTEIAGTSIGLANFHFESKERLFEAVLTHLADEQRALWQNRNVDASLTTADRLMAIIDSRFHSRICDRKKLAIWFAFYGDAGARDIYRKVVGNLDDELLDATVAILKLMIAEGHYTGIDPMETALAMEAMYDGLWLNMLLYPSEFKRLDCRARALDFIAAILPRHFQSTRGKS
jgi:TetR/AcrR family transcriptional regulator, transcriptional repressor of bet genes